VPPSSSREVRDSGEGSADDPKPEARDDRGSDRRKGPEVPPELLDGVGPWWRLTSRCFFFHGASSPLGVGIRRQGDREALGPGSRLVLSVAVGHGGFGRPMSLVIPPVRRRPQARRERSSWPGPRTQRSRPMRMRSYADQDHRRAALDLQPEGGGRRRTELCRALEPGPRCWRIACHLIMVGPRPEPTRTRTAAP